MSSSTRVITILLASVLAATAPASALLVVAPTAAPPMAAATDPCVVSSQPAACSGVLLLNGDAEGAREKAFEAAASAYATSLPARVREIYAHQLAILQNPVLNPGFLLVDDQNDAGSWTADANVSVVAGRLVIPGSSDASQTFGESSSDDDLDTGIAASPYWAPDMLELNWTGKGSVTIALSEETLGADWSITVPLNATAGATARFRLLDFAEDIEVDTGFADPEVMPAEDALATSALLGFTVAADAVAALSVDDVLLDGVAYGIEPATAFELDATVPDGLDELVPLLPSNPLAATMASAHDGYEVVIVPLDFVPSLLTDGAEGASAHASASVTGRWRFFVALVAMTPSGPMNEDVASGTLNAGGAPAALARTNLSQVGATGAAFGELYAALGLGDLHGGVVVLEDVTPANVTALEAVVTPMTARFGVTQVRGVFNYGKLAHPARAFADLSDPVPENVFAGRSALGAASYLAARRTEGNDGFVASIAPAGWRPLADGDQAQALLVPDGASKFHFDLSFVDYTGAPADGDAKLLAFIPADDPATVAAALAGAGGDVAWYDLATYRVCSPAFSSLAGITCNLTIPNNAAPDVRVSIPFAEIVNLTHGVGGAFAPIAFTAVDGAALDAELGVAPTRGAFSPTANGLLAQAETFRVPLGSAEVGPYWLYAAADAASQILALVRFAPAADAADGTAVIIRPREVDADRGAERLIPDELGNYNFTIEFREYDDSGSHVRSVRPTNATGDGFRFTLADAPLAGPRGPVAALWEISENAVVTATQDSYIVSIPAWDIARTPAAAPTQLLTAWSAMQRPFRNTSFDAPLDANAGQAGGYYNAPKLEFDDDAIADQLDTVPGAFLIDHTLEVYDLAITPVDVDWSTSRGEAAFLSFSVKNEGNFLETVELSLDNVDTSKVEADVCLPTCPPEEGPDAPQDGPPTIELAANESRTIVVQVVPLATMQNHETSTLDLVATLAHPVPGATAFQDLRTSLAGAVTLDPFAYTVSATPSTADLRYFDPGTSTVTLTNGEVGETFTFAVRAPTGFNVGAAPTSQTLGENVTGSPAFTFGVNSTTRYGSVGSAFLDVRPAHASGAADNKTATVAITVPSSSLTITQLSTVSTMPGRAGTIVNATFMINYTGRYLESFNLSASHGTAAWSAAGISLAGTGSSGTNTAQVTFDGSASSTGLDVPGVILNASFTVPTNLSFNSQDTVTIRYASADPRSTIGRTSGGVETPLILGQFTVRTLTASLTLVANGTQYGLPGETVRQGFVATYLGEFPGEFQFDVTASPLGGTVAALQASSQTFNGGLDTPTTVTRDLVFDVTLPDATAYAATGGLTLTTTGLSVGWDATQTPAPRTASVGTFSLTAPSVTFAIPAPRTFQNDVVVTHSITISQNALTGAQATQWGSREVAYGVSYAIDAGTWRSQTLSLSAISLTQGGSATVTLSALPDNITSAANFSVSAQSTILRNPLASTSVVRVTPYTAADFAVHSILTGCYGDSAATCQRLNGPVQAVSTHDLPDQQYGRAYVVTAVILRGSAPAYLSFDPDSTDRALNNTSATVHVDAQSIDAAQAGDDRDARAVRGASDDENFTSSVSGGQVIGLPVVGATAHRGMLNLLWDTADPASGDLEWYLTHLGTLEIAVTVDLHGLILESHYDPVRAVFPLLAAAAEGTAIVTTDKDDPDGDGYATASELRGNSNPLIRSSHPFADDDGDRSANSRDTIPLVDEACLEKDVQDADDIPSCAAPPGASPVLSASVTAPAPTQFGPAEIAPHVARLTGAYHVPEA